MLLLLSADKLKTKKKKMLAHYVRTYKYYYSYSHDLRKQAFLIDCSLIKLVCLINWYYEYSMNLTGRKGSVSTMSEPNERGEGRAKGGARGGNERARGRSRESDGRGATRRTRCSARLRMPILL